MKINRAMNTLRHYARPIVAAGMLSACARQSSVPNNYVQVPDYAVLSIIEGEMGKTRCADKQPFPLAAEELAPKLVSYALQHDPEFKPLFDKLPASNQKQLITELAAEVAKDTAGRASGSLLFPDQLSDYQAYCQSYQDPNGRLQVSLFPSVALTTRAIFLAGLTNANSLAAVEILGIAPGPKPLSLQSGHSATFILAFDSHLPIDIACYRAQESNGVTFTVNKAANYRANEKDGYFDKDAEIISKPRTNFAFTAMAASGATGGPRDVRLIYTCRPDKKDAEVSKNAGGWLTVFVPQAINSSPDTPKPPAVQPPNPVETQPAAPAPQPAPGPEPTTPRRKPAFGNQNGI